MSSDVVNQSLVPVASGEPDMAERALGDDTISAAEPFELCRVLVSAAGTGSQPVYVQSTVKPGMVPPETGKPL